LALSSHQGKQPCFANQSSSGTDARTVEARLFRTFWDDGQIDLFFGGAILGIGAFWDLDLIPLGAVVPVVLAVLWSPLRRAIIEPRAGRAEFSVACSTRGRRLLLGACGVGLGVLLLLLLAAITRGAGAIALDDVIVALKRAGG
jgi:hypothetical protein